MGHRRMKVMSAVVGLHYQPISREDAFQKIAAHFNALASPDEAAFYSTVKKMLDNMFIGGRRRGTMTGCWISVLQKQGVCFFVPSASFISTVADGGM